MYRKKLLCFLFLLLIFVNLDAYEPLNLEAPSSVVINHVDSQQPAETFVLCNLSEHIYRDYCLNNGTCYALISESAAVEYEKQQQRPAEIFCSCSIEFTGKRCETKTAVSVVVNQESCPISFKCFNGGQCEMDNNVPTCKCSANFTGPDCSAPVKFQQQQQQKKQRLQCPMDMRDCPLVCDFGYQKSATNHGCLICRCNCVNESNYFDEIMNTIAANAAAERGASTFELQQQSSSNLFCQKTCKHGYLKDKFGCYKCICAEPSSPTILISSGAGVGGQKKLKLDSTIMMNLLVAPPPSPLNSNPNSNNSNRMLLLPASVNNFTASGAGLIHDICNNIKCKVNEVCKYFDANMYRCPDERMDCSPYESSMKIPVCVSTLHNGRCLESIKIGSCRTYSQRFYYDIIDKECKKFYFSGCDGNGNNFESYEECKKVCSKPFTVDSLKQQQQQQQPAILSKFNLNPSPSSPSYLPLPPQFANFNPEANLDAQRLNKETLTAPQNTNNNDSSAESASSSDQAAACEWVCNLNCPFGYQLDPRTKCYKCECIDLNMTECGVPCFLTGTKSCLFSMRANSRPKCVCNNDYEGVYCQTYNQQYNFTVRIDDSIKLYAELINQIKTSLSKKLSNLLEIGTNHVTIFDIYNDQRDRIAIRFGLNAPDFSNKTSFGLIVDKLQQSLNARNLTIHLLNNGRHVLTQVCEKNEELFSMELNEKYLLRIDQLKQMILDLKSDLTAQYRFAPHAIDFVSVKLEPVVRMEFLITNRNFDPEFCTKSLTLQNEIRSKGLTLRKYETRHFEFADVHDERSSNNDLANWNRERDDFDSNMKHVESSIGRLTSPHFMNHSIIFVSVVVASFLVLLFLVGLIVVTHFRRKQTKEISRSEDTISHITLNDNNYSKVIRSSNNELNGYFLPAANYAANQTNNSSSSASSTAAVTRSLIRDPTNLALHPTMQMHLAHQ